MGRTDPEAVRLAQAMGDAAYEVSRTITNREWIISEGRDYDAVLAAAKAARSQARAAYVAYKDGDPR